MANNGRVVVGCSHGEEDPDNVVVAYLTAGARARPGQGKSCSGMTSDGVRLGIAGLLRYLIREDKDPPVERVHAQFIEKGGALLRLSDLLQRARSERRRVGREGGVEGVRHR